MMKEILLDTNFLMLPHKKRIDVFSEMQKLFSEKHGFVTLSGVVSELERIAEGAGDDASAAKTALRLIESNRVKVVESEGPTDKAIEDYAKKRDNVVVCTNDKGLKGGIKALGRKTVSLGGADRLVTF